MKATTLPTTTVIGNIEWQASDHSIAEAVAKIGIGIAKSFSILTTFALSILGNLDPTTRQFLVMFASFAPLGVAGLIGVNSNRRVRIAVTIAMPIMAFLLSNFSGISSAADAQGDGRNELWKNFLSGFGGGSSGLRRRRSLDGRKTRRSGRVAGRRR
jgi:hypothetical protein